MIKIHQSVQLKAVGVEAEMTVDMGTRIWRSSKRSRNRGLSRWCFTRS